MPYEYMLLVYIFTPPRQAQDVDQQLNAAARDGWEVLTMTEFGSGRGDPALAFLLRRLTGSPAQL